MTYLPPFALFGARTAVEEGRIDDHVADWVQLLVALRDGRLDVDRAAALPRLNQDLPGLLGAPGAGREG
jgi:hypothetical protein